MIIVINTNNNSINDNDNDWEYVNKYKDPRRPREQPRTWTRRPASPSRPGPMGAATALCCCRLVSHCGALPRDPCRFRAALCHRFRDAALSVCLQARRERERERSGLFESRLQDRGVWADLGPEADPADHCESPLAAYEDLRGAPREWGIVRRRRQDAIRHHSDIAGKRSSSTPVLPEFLQRREIRLRPLHRAVSTDREPSNTVGSPLFPMTSARGPSGFRCSCLMSVFRGRLPRLRATPDCRACRPRQAFEDGLSQIPRS